MKLTVLQQFKATEASSLAKTLCQKETGTYRVNFRLMNKMLNFSKRSKKRDETIHEEMELLVADLLLKEKNVVIDSAQLQPAEVEKWRLVAGHFGAEFEVITPK